VAFLIGNGLSRKGFDLESLRGQGHIIGCNWLYRDFTPDTLTMIDTPPQHAIREAMDNDTPFRRLTQSLGRRHILLDGEIIAHRNEHPGPYFNNSGVMSGWYCGEFLKAQRVYMIGVDFFRPTDAVNENGSPTNDIYGINTIGRHIQHCYNHLARQYSDTEFVRVGPIEERDRLFYERHVDPIIKRQETL
jgi:hypothetical protein